MNLACRNWQCCNTHLRCSRCLTGRVTYKHTLVFTLWRMLRQWLQPTPSFYK